MTTQHTPGPWFVNEDSRPGMNWNRHIHSGRNTAVCFMAHSDGQKEEMDEANARLVAAAPDLLAALKTLMGMLDDDIKTSTDEQLAFGLADPQCPEHIKSELACVIACRAAIAKAEGGAA